jgi:hypothetical protein
MVPHYGYNSRKNTFLPPYSLAVLTFMECTREGRAGLEFSHPFEELHRASRLNSYRTTGHTSSTAVLLTAQLLEPTMLLYDLLRRLPPGESLAKRSCKGTCTV